MAFAKINYGGNAVAEFWGNFPESDMQEAFYRHANQCFGIRKSIMGFTLLRYDADQNLPEPWNKIEGAATVLKHSGDTIVFGTDGEKIKSEWD